MDEARFLTMSRKELNRLEILGRALERRLTQAQAAEQLGLSVRQVERLCRKLRVEGAPGLVSKKRGRMSNRTLPGALGDRALELIQSRYHDFGPTLAAEKLRELHDVIVSVETLRKWMIDAVSFTVRFLHARFAEAIAIRRAAGGKLGIRGRGRCP